MYERVVLVHGLWMNALAMVPLQARIARCGFRVERFGYRSVMGAPDHSAGRLSRFVSGLKADRVHLVGHSLGGILILRALAQQPDARIGRVVLLGTPLAGSRAGRGLSRFRVGRWMLGESRTLWQEASPPPAPAGVEVGVLAGNLAVGLGRIVARLTGPNDGAVTVAETAMPGAADSMVLRVSHSGLLVSGAVARQVCAFLKQGRFSHD